MEKTNQIEIIKNLSSLDHLQPAELVSLLKFLIANERSPSGPYSLSEQSEENHLLNTKIYTLFAKKNKILKGTSAYIHSSHNFTSSLPSNKATQSQNKSSLIPRPIHQAVFEQAAKVLTPELYEHVAPTLDKILKQDSSGEITQLSSAFVNSLTIPLKSEPSKKHLALLGEANFYTWAAYTLYDTLLDTPQHNPLGITAANIFHRLALSTYINAGLSFETLNYAFNSVDRANAEEASNCRLTIENGMITIEKIPTKKNLRKLLASRSSIHCLGPLALISKPSNTSVHYRKSKSILNTYCAVRQLNDDIHDWEADISQGHISYVVAHLLQAAKIPNGTFNLQGIIEKLQVIFWEKELENLVNECLKMCHDTQDAFRKDFNLMQNSCFENLTLQPIVNACLSAKKTINYSKQFLQEIKN